MNRLKLVFVLTIIVFGSQLRAQHLFSGFEHLFTPVRQYTVFRASSEIIIDGESGELAWEKTAWTEDFQDIEGEIKPLPLHRTRVKMLWDEKNLYILAELEEPHVWGYFDEHDVIVFNENDFEVFIDPDGDSQNYFEIEINANNTVFDLFMPKPYRDGGIPLISWNAPGLKTAVSVDGTRNNPNDADKKWTVEMAIPFSALQLGTGTQKPVDNQVWRINFSRVQWKTEVVDGIYKRKTDSATGRILSEDNWVWSPQGVINMHVPERWGMIQFSEKLSDDKKDGFNISEKEELAQYLWLVYYKQKKFQAENKKFATSLSEISIPETIDTKNSGTVQLELTATPHQFLLKLITENGKQMSITENGILRK
jgi:hypothetical protein